MIIASGRSGGTEGSKRVTIKRWALWSVPQRALLLILCVEALAGTLTVVGLVSAHPTSSDVARFALLMVLSAIYGEAEDRTDRFRRARAEGSYIDATSVWVFAAVLLLPSGFTALLVAIIYAHALLRAHRYQYWRPHR